MFRLVGLLALLFPGLAMSQDQTGIQIIVLQADGSTTGMHLAMGAGENLQFASSLDPSQVQWTSNEDGIRTGRIIDPALVNSIAQGVCAGPACEITIGSQFTSDVGGALPGR